MTDDAPCPKLYSKCIPINVGNIAKLIDRHVAPGEDITFQLIDRTSASNVFVKPFTPDDGWGFFWATDKNDTPFAYECATDKQTGKMKVFCNGFMPYPPYAQLVPDENG